MDPKYYCFDLRTNLLIPGDWGWYLETYKQRRQSNGEQKWASEGSTDFEIRAYKVPKALERYLINAVEFTPSSALNCGEEPPDAPDYVRWGIVVCLQTDLITRIGIDVVQRNFLIGKLKDSSGRVSTKWNPVVCRNHFSVGLNRGAIAYDEYLRGGEAYDDNRFSIILREDLFNRIKEISTAGCEILEWSAFGKGKGRKAAFKKWK